MSENIIMKIFGKSRRFCLVRTKVRLHLKKRDASGGHSNEKPQLRHGWGFDMYSRTVDNLGLTAGE
jgi:hypothetical protein